MNIYDGVDDTTPILMSLCGNNATTGTRLLSTGNMMFMMLKSGRDSQNMYFQANFTSTKPPSGMYFSLSLKQFWQEDALAKQSPLETCFLQ